LRVFGRVLIGTEMVEIEIIGMKEGRSMFLSLDLTFYFLPEKKYA